MSAKHVALLLVAAGLFMVAAPSRATELLTNGNFETCDLSGWTPTDQAGSGGSFYIGTPGDYMPVSGVATSGNASGGACYAVSDEDGPATTVLTQSFFVTPGSTVTLSFQMFVNDLSDSGGIVNPAGLDYTVFPNQHARVDILTGTAGAFDTGAGVLDNLYLGVDAGSNPNPYTNYSYNLTSIVGGGGTFQIRFAQVDNQDVLNMGVDNVSIDAMSSVPEPSGLGMLGLLGVIGLGRRRIH